MNQLNTEKTIGELFHWGILLKGIHAIIEIIGAVLLFTIPLDVITKFTIWITQEELLDDPNDLIANYVFHLGTGLSLSATTFGVLYLSSHGIIKLILVIGLLKNKLWAYPLSLWVLGIFIAYQCYRFTYTHAIGLVVLTVFDVAVIWLVWREYQIVKKHISSGQPMPVL